MSELKDFRKAKDQFFAQDPHSPLLPEQRLHFQGLDYFPEDPNSADGIHQDAEFCPEHGDSPIRRCQHVERSDAAGRGSGRRGYAG